MHSKKWERIKIILSKLYDTVSLISATQLAIHMFGQNTSAKLLLPKTFQFRYVSDKYKCTWNRCCWYSAWPGEHKATHAYITNISQPSVSLSFTEEISPASLTSRVSRCHLNTVVMTSHQWEIIDTRAWFDRSGARSRPIRSLRYIWTCTSIRPIRILVVILHSAYPENHEAISVCDTWWYLTICRHML